MPTNESDEDLTIEDIEIPPVEESDEDSPNSDEVVPEDESDSSKEQE